MRRLTPALLGLIAACSPASEPQGGSVNAAAPAAAPADSPRLTLPIDCVVGVSCEVQNYPDRDPGPGASDYRCGTQTYEAHDAIDIRLLDMAAQRRGVDVLAAAPGRVVWSRDGVADVSVRVAGPASVSGKECGNGVGLDHGGGWISQYCHLAKGSQKVKLGDAVVAGQPLAKVGLSGNTEYPHLHMSIRQANVVVDPFRPGAVPADCAAPSGGLWDAKTAKALAYQPGVVLNAGFAGDAVTMEAVEEARLTPAAPRAPALLAYARAINLRGGDVAAMTLTAPDGTVLARNSLPPLDRAKAQHLLFVGKRTPAEGWKSGRYSAVYTVTRNGAVVLERRFQLAL